jgi:hypothetical protein
VAHIADLVWRWERGAERAAVPAKLP